MKKYDVAYWGLIGFLIASFAYLFVAMVVLWSA